MESQQVEFKKSLSELREGMESLCGMLNTDLGKGCIKFGINPDGTVEGINGNLDEAQLKIKNEIRSNFNPQQIQLDIRIETIENKQIIVVLAQRITNIHLYQYRGRCWIQEGSSKRHLTIQEQQHFLKLRDRDNHNGPWRCNKCGIVWGFLSGIVLTDTGLKKSYSCSDCGGEFFPLS